jgi:phosphate-selective porin OprO and OprP
MPFAEAASPLPPSSQRRTNRGLFKTTPSQRLLSLPIALALIAGSGAAFAASDAERIAALEQRIAELESRLNAVLAAAPAAAAAPAESTRVDELEQSLRVVQRKLEIKDEETVAALPNTPVITAGEKGFALASRDARFNLRLRGLVHADTRDFLDDETLAPSVDGFLLRRVRPSLEGTIAGIYDFRINPDFAGSRVVLQDAYVDARYFPGFKVRVGKFKTPFGIERLQSASDLRFVERGLPNNLVPNRDLGIQLHGDVLGGTLNYAVGLFNGVLEGGSSEASNDVENNTDKDLAARLFAQPFLNSDNFYLRGLGLGISATYVDQRADALAPLLPAYRSPGQISVFNYRSGSNGTFSDGQRLRWSPQLHYYAGPWGVLAETVNVDQEVSRIVGGVRRHDTLSHDAWQLALNYVLTGEDASYKEIKPKAPWAPGSEGWGAWELVARVGELDIDDATFTGGNTSFADPNVAISNESAWSLGVNWYLNRNIKWSFDYEQTDFEGGASAGQDRADEKIAFSRVQLVF